nr:hypothetical protein CFP56_75112 [Quercus suber]
MSKGDDGPRLNKRAGLGPVDCGQEMASYEWDGTKNSHSTCSISDGAVIVHVRLDMCYVGAEKRLPEAEGCLVGAEGNNPQTAIRAP